MYNNLDNSLLEERCALTSKPLEMHRFRDADDIKYYFQRELDKFPRINGRLMFAEFGAFLIRPKGEPKNRLTHIVFPQTIVAIPNVGNSLQDHSSRTFPQIFLMAEANTNNLYIKISADRTTADGLPERVSLILSMNQVFPNSDIWRLFSDEDKAPLAEYNFGPNMDYAEWGSAINQCQGHFSPIKYATTINGDFIATRELPISINQLGCIGANGSFHHMPKFLIDVIKENEFIFDESYRKENEEDNPYEIGGAHIHPKWGILNPLQQAVADIIGQDILNRTPSVPDIVYQRSSRSINKDLSMIFRGKEISTIESVEMIVETDEDGCVTGLRVFDFGDADMDKLTRLNELALGTLESSSPDIQIVVDHYRYIDSLTKTDFGTPGNSEHVGDPDFDRLATED